MVPVGKFNGVEINPTTLIVNELKTDPDADTLNTTFQILDVSIDGVDSFHKSLKNADVCNFFIHLGVSGSATCFNLETCGYNCNNFRVPDESGNQPCNECIVGERELNSSLSTALDLTCMKAKLQRLASSSATGNVSGIDTGNTIDGGQGCTDNTDICISVDPGRFLCNYVYYRSLSYCLELSKSREQKASTALFVHVPPVAVFPLEVQVDFVKRLLHWVREYAETAAV
jgi:pyrrolidone-carboxylate peptidase